MNLIEPVVSEEFANIHTHIQRAYGYYSIDNEMSKTIKIYTNLEKKKWVSAQVVLGVQRKLGKYKKQKHY